MNKQELAWPKILVIGVMCMAQTFPYFMVNSTVPTLFRAEGLELKNFWAFSLLTVPAWAKFLWAPYVDSYGWSRLGMRKSWIVICTSLGALSISILIFTPPSASNLVPVIAILFIHMTIMMTQDIAVDAYTLENLKEHERGAGSAFKAFCESIGEALALGGLPLIYTMLVFGGADNGWTPMVLSAAVLLLIFTTPVVIRHEPKLAPEIVKRRAEGDRPRISKFIFRGDTPFIALLLFVGGFINFMLPALIGPLLIDKGFKIVEVGIILGAVMPIASPLGAISAGLLVTRFGITWTLCFLAVCGFVSVAIAMAAVHSVFSIPDTGFSFIAWISVFFPAWDAAPRVLYAIATLIPIGIVVSQLHMIIIVSRMGWASRTQAGTDFSLHGAIYNIGRTAAVAISPFIASYFGWTMFLGVLGMLILIFTALYLTNMTRLNVLLNQRRRQEGELSANSAGVPPARD